MNETKIQNRFKRLKKTELIVADTVSHQGDMYHISKWIDDSRYEVKTSYARHNENTMPPGVEELFNDDARNCYVYGKPAHEEIIKEMYTDYFKPWCASWNFPLKMSLGDHSIHPNTAYKYVAIQPNIGNLNIQYDKVFGSKQLPVIHYNLNDKIPTDLKDDRGNFIVTLDNIQVMEALAGREAVERGMYTHNTALRCPSLGCRNRVLLEQVRETSIVGVLRRKNTVHLKTKCTECGCEDMLIPIHPLRGIPTSLSGIKYYIADITLSDDYSLETRNNARYPKPKLLMKGCSNAFKWDNYSWGQAVIKSTMEYAKKLNIPVEIK